MASRFLPDYSRFQEKIFLLLILINREVIVKLRTLRVFCRDLCALCGKLLLSRRLEYFAMNLYNHTDMKILKKPAEIKAFLALLRQRASGGTGAVEETVKKILSDVKSKGDRAVLGYTRKFDSLKTGTLRMKASEISKHADKADRKIVRSLELSAKRIRAFHEMQKEESWSFWEGDTLLGQMVRPLERVGVYVPGGKASYPSSVLMNVIPAQVAGVDEIALCVPTPGDEINPYVMAAIRMLGVKEVYRMGGAQAVAAMA